MAKQKKSRKQYLAGGIAAGITAVLYASLLPLNRPVHFLLFAGLSALIGWVVYTMAGGLDVSQKAPVQRPFTATGNPTVDQLVQHGMQMLSDIREENRSIPDEALSARIDELEDISRRIFVTVADKPEKAPQIRRFMDYYLPTVLKMLNNYRKLGERAVTGENADRMKKTVEDAMDVVLDAFRKQHDQLYMSDMLDMTSDARVLETMLKQDGLLENVADPAKAGAADAKPVEAQVQTLQQ